ncbi:hypothetical protein P879_00137 [Paragonimus westermani]|uniref:Uncharacterized protein n=1 Tax=Paragonimus westermani TaxID=34504 RepID=A0A8T0DM80_9TREM|nr:hypothetical protein P879_00137 [Paragonimus westermani]
MDMTNQNQARQSDYRKEVEAIKQRISNRPLLVTQQAQSIARKRMEEKIDNSLKHSGLDPRKPLSVKTSEKLIRTRPDSPTAKRWNSQDEVEGIACYLFLTVNYLFKDKSESELKPYGTFQIGQVIADFAFI